jgi:hypothetical protein
MTGKALLYTRHKRYLYCDESIDDPRITIEMRKHCKQWVAPLVKRTKQAAISNYNAGDIKVLY